MKPRPYGVQGTRNEHLLAALEVVLRERAVTRDEWHIFREGFIEGWRALADDQHARGMTTVNREYLAALEIAAGAREADR